MRTLASVVIALVSLSFMIESADAARLSGGRNSGMQRSAPAQQQAAPKSPAQQQQQQAVPATPAQQPTGASKWLGPLAGLALGAGLAALFLNNGAGGLLAGVLLIGLIIAVVALGARALMRNRTAQGPLQYAGAGAGAGVQPTLDALPGGAGMHSVAATTGRWPAGFDATEFVRHARLNFVRLQEAYDKKDLSTLRDFLAPDVYREIESDIRAAGTAEERTEVLTLEAEVLDVAEEAGSYIVSVRFTGMIRESAGREAEPFSEIWHLQKPLSGRAGWMLAGIQQAWTRSGARNWGPGTGKIGSSPDTRAPLLVLNPESRIPNPAAALDTAVAAFINHLLRSASWARDALRRHAGKTARFEVLPLAVALTVLDSGEVAPAAAGADPAATVKIAPGLMLRLAARDESAWREVDIAGDTDFASAIHRVTRNLRWDVEEDLARVFGDVAAHRMAEAGRTLQRWGEQATENTGRAFAEYWTEEQPLIAGARDLEEFGRAVDQLRDDTARLEKRIEGLSNRHVTP